MNKYLLNWRAKLINYDPMMVLDEKSEDLKISGQAAFIDTAQYHKA